MRTRTLLIVLTIVGAGCGLGVVGGSVADDAGAGGTASASGGASGGPVDPSAPTLDNDVDASTSPPVTTPVDAGRRDAGDAAGVDAGRRDSGVDAAIPPPVFGDECPTGTVYEDDFSVNPADRWFPVAATWTWDQANKTYTVTGFNPHGVTWIGPRPKWRNYAVEASIRVSASTSADGNAGPVFRIVDVGDPPYVNNDGHMYLAAVVLNGADDVIFGTENDGTWTQHDDTKNVNIPSNQWITMRVEVANQSVKVHVGDKKAIDTSNGTYAAGSIGFKTYRLNLSIRSVKVTCL